MARFDRLVDIPKPDTVGRAALLDRYLRRVPEAAAIDVDRVAAGTEGATGADLRELVTLAGLHTAPSGGGALLGTDLLLRLAADAGYRTPTGQYL